MVLHGTRGGRECYKMNKVKGKKQKKTEHIKNDGNKTHEPNSVKGTDNMLIFKKITLYNAT